MIDAVLFDLGDTIIDFGVGRREAEVLFRARPRLTYDYLADKNIPLPPFHLYFRIHYRYMHRAYLWSKISRRDFSYADILAFSAKKLHLHLASSDLHHLAWLWYQPIGDVSHIEHGVRHMLLQLRPAGTKLAIVSNTFVPPHCLDRHLSEQGLLEFFPVRVYSSHVRYRKPHPRIFELALKQVGVPANRTLFIGDLINTDISGTSKAGMHTIWKPARNTPLSSHHLSHPTPALLPRPSRILRQHHATPDFIIHKITQLPDILHHFGWHPNPNSQPASPKPLTLSA